MSAMMMDEPYVNSPYPAGVAINREILTDLNNELSDEEIIMKLQSTPDLMMALWGEGDLHQLRYVPLHHAASRGRELLVDFILAHRAYPELVNIMNDNYFTALRYANRSNFPQVIAMLQSAGATEDFPNITISCPCGSDFVYTSDKQARFNAQNFQAPRHYGNCRAARKAQQGGGNNNNHNGGGYQQRGGYGGGFGGDRNNNGGGGGYRNNNFNNNNNGFNNNRGGFGGGRNNGSYQPREGGGYQPRGTGGYQQREQGGGFQQRDNNNNGYYQNNSNGGNYQQRPQRNYGNGNEGGNGYYGGFNRDHVDR